VFGVVSSHRARLALHMHMYVKLETHELLGIDLMPFVIGNKHDNNKINPMIGLT
jgi:hypothetical protein